jgi:hypothetical protein
VYHNSSSLDHTFFYGRWDVHGGRASANAEHGAAGTAYVEHVTTGENFLRVDNTDNEGEPQFALSSIIRNAGRRLDLRTGVVADSNRRWTSQGVVVQSSEIPDAEFDLRHLFGHTYSADGFFRTLARDPVLTITLDGLMYVSYIRIFPQCSSQSYMTDFKVETRRTIEPGNVAVTSNFVELSGGCIQGSFVELPVLRGVNQIFVSLRRRSQTLNRYSTLSAVEIYVEGADVENRYDHLLLDSAKTWITPESGQSDHKFDRLELFGGAQLAFLPLSKTNRPTNVTFDLVEGDKLGWIHVGPLQKFDIVETASDIPFNARIYETAVMNTQKRAFLNNVQFHVSGQLNGFQETFVYEGGLLRVDTNGSISSEVNREIFMEDLIIHADGDVELFAHQINDTGFDLHAENITLYGYGELLSNTRLRMHAVDFEVGSGGFINLNDGGFETREVREVINDERTGLPDYDAQEGPGQGLASQSRFGSDGASGAGHGKQL